MANPYTFGFLDQLVRINFPQNKGDFLTTDGFGNYFTSNDGITWTVAHSNFLSSNNGGLLTCAFQPAKTDSTGKVTTDQVYVLIGLDGDPGFLVIAWSKDLKIWADIGSGGTPTNNFQIGIPATAGGFDPTAKKLWASILTKNDPDGSLITWLTTSSDGKAWDAEEVDFVSLTFTTYFINEKTGTKIIPGHDAPDSSNHLCDVYNVTTGDYINLGGPNDGPEGRRVADVAWSPVGGSKGTYVATGGACNNITFPQGNMIWSSTDDGVTWTVRYQENHISPVANFGLGTCVVGRKSNG